MKLSIIIPTLNEEKTIGATLTNLRRLSLPHEVIVADDKSTDRTVELARPLADTVIECTAEKRWTIAEGRNTGARAAHGEFLVFFDADATIGDPNPFFAHALARFAADPTLVGLTGTLRVLPAVETWTDRFMFGIINFGIRLTNNLIGRGQGALGKFQMVRANAFETIHGYNEKLVALEDSDLFARLAKVGTTRYDPALTVFHPARRAHTKGWAWSIWTWFINFIYMNLFGVVRSKEWTPVR